MFNSHHPDPRCVWRWGPSSSSGHHFAGIPGIGGRIAGVLVLVRRRSIYLFARKMMSNFQQFPEDAPQGSHRYPKTAEGLPKGAQGGQRDKTEFIKQIFHEKYTMLIPPKGNKSAIHQLEKLELHPEDLLVTLCHQNHFVTRNPNTFPWSIRSVWYHYFGLNIQEMAST